MTYQIVFIAGDVEFEGTWAMIPQKGSVINFYHNVYDREDDDRPPTRLMGIYEVVDVHYESPAYGANPGDRLLVASPTVRVFIEAIEDDSKLIAHLENRSA